MVAKLLKLVDFAKVINSSTENIDSRRILDQFLRRVQSTGSTLEQIHNVWIESNGSVEIDINSKVFDQNVDSKFDEIFSAIVDNLVDVFSQNRATFGVVSNDVGKRRRSGDADIDFVDKKRRKITPTGPDATELEKFLVRKQNVF